MQGCMYESHVSVLQELPMSYNQASPVSIPMDLPYSQARIGLATYKNSIDMTDKYNKEKGPVCTERIMVRLPLEQKREIEENARKCGLTVCAYVRKCLMGRTPRQRMTDEQMAALNSFSDARGDVVRLFSLLKGLRAEERKKYLHNWAFIAQWMTAANLILERMKDVEKYFLD